MKFQTKIICIAYFLFLFACAAGCKKSDFLSAKPTTAIVVPTTLSDFQALLDNDQQLAETPALGQLSSDEYSLDPDFWQSLYYKKEHNAYVWAADIYQGETQIPDWDYPYQEVFYANVVLEGLTALPASADNAVDRNILKGSALFIRAYAFFNIAQLFAPTYDSTTAKTDAGIPLRLSSDINPKTIRATVQQTYDKIISDVTEAINLLPPAVPQANRNRPSKPAAFALLARLFLSIRDYNRAGLYADSALQLYNELIDYNSVTTASTRKFTALNDETIYQSRASYYSSPQALQYLTYSTSSQIDSTLYASYNDSNDLRITIFFKPRNAGINLNGLYNGSFYCFSGLATDELFLIRAECYARSGNIQQGINDLNSLLSQRWRTGTFIPHTAVSVTDALSQILNERKKELIFRGTRWTDLRRLNKEGFNITLQRIIQGRVYTLPPNSPLYVLPIPPDVISLTGIAQNSR